MNGSPGAIEDTQDSLGALPEWDLSDLYPAPDSDRLDADLKAAEAKAKQFRDGHQGRLAQIDFNP